MDPEIVPIRENGAPTVRLLCFAYAGGDPSLFRAWTTGLAAEVDILTVRLPGHGKMISRRPYLDWETLRERLFRVVSPILAEPHAFYGHSFGGRIAYELTRMAESTHPGRTARLFVSGCRSPDHPQRRPFMHTRSDPEFRAVLREMGGTPKEVLDDDTLMQVLLPTIRGEIRLAELWQRPAGDRVRAPITAMFGRADTVEDPGAMEGWRRFSRTAAEVLPMPGGHFFVETHRSELLAVINARLGSFAHRAGSDERSIRSATGES